MPPLHQSGIQDQGQHSASMQHTFQDGLWQSSEGRQEPGSLLFEKALSLFQVPKMNLPLLVKLPTAAPPFCPQPARGVSSISLKSLLAVKIDL